MFHKDDDGAGGVAGGQFAIFVIPNDVRDVSGVVGQVCAFVTLGTVALYLEGIQLDQL